ncbi:hypothetical protein D515_01881 [Grimontia indica]|uniref:Uncharacterized protein n=1 Tax=Grimontia indica TaxID=1056512 RepID=R1IP18_9GAMM|nr:hypothetical protein D515_01881 [Grimontia indica]
MIAYAHLTKNASITGKYWVNTHAFAKVYTKQKNKPSSKLLGL